MTERPDGTSSPRPQKRVLFLDVKMPRPDRDAASLRSAQMIGFLARRANIDLAVLSSFGVEKEAGALAGSLGAHLVGAGDPRQICAHIRAEGRHYDLVVMAWSRTATAFLHEVRSAAPGVPVVFDTHDVNHVREFRHARVTLHSRRIQAALSLRTQEVAAMRESDVTVAITDVDREVLSRLVPEARIEVAGIWVEPAPPALRGVDPVVLFVGHYKADPNMDAARILAREVLPLVRARVPGAVLQLAGSDPIDSVRELEGPGVVVPGWEADLSVRLAGARVFAAYLRFGSGLKGKVLQAVAHRVPLVATAVAVEGTGLVDGRDYLGAETPAECADRLAEILANPGLGRRLADSALVCLQQRFSRTVVESQFDRIFRPYLGEGDAGAVRRST